MPVFSEGDRRAVEAAIVAGGLKKDDQSGTMHTPYPFRPGRGEVGNPILPPGAIATMNHTPHFVRKAYDNTYQNSRDRGLGAPEQPPLPKAKRSY